MQTVDAGEMGGKGKGGGMSQMVYVDRKAFCVYALQRLSGGSLQET